ncbi:MAG: fibronectin type III domain-containing protein [Ruminococcus sp.]|nr:fibronectin type III domain-containing protein [Ruminococcus sp.]
MKLKGAMNIMNSKKLRFAGALMAAVISAGAMTAGGYAAPGNKVYADSAASSSAVPSNFSYTSTATSVTLKWDAVAGADAYRIYRYNGNTKKYVKVKNVAGNSCTLTGLSKATKY